MSDLLYTGRGCTALWLCLNIAPTTSNKILLPVNICEVVVATARYAGFTPIFYDVDPVSGNSTLSHIEAVYTDETLLLVAHNFGQPVPVRSIMSWAKKRDVFVIEDVCNAFGAEFEKVTLGEYGDASIFSFGYAKLIEYGLGGAIKFKQEKLYYKAVELNNTLREYSEEISKEMLIFQHKLSEIRKKGSPSDYIQLYDRFSPLFIYSLSEQDIKNIKQKCLHAQTIINERQSKADIYRLQIKNPNITHRPQHKGEVVWRYTLLCSNQKFRDRLVKSLRAHNILVSQWYPRVDTLFGYSQGDFSGASIFEEKVINLFVDHRVTMETIHKTAVAINEFN